MITILSVIACVHGHNAMCAEIAVPTPITFACDEGTGAHDRSRLSQQ
jgi:hypothetical protein